MVSQLTEHPTDISSPIGQFSPIMEAEIFVIRFMASTCSAQVGGFDTGSFIFAQHSRNCGVFDGGSGYVDRSRIEAFGRIRG